MATMIGEPLVGVDARVFTGLLPATLASTGYSAPMSLGLSKNVRFQAKTAAATDTPVGVFTLEGSDDWRKVSADISSDAYGNADTAQWTQVPIPTGSVSGLNGTALALSSGTLTTDGSAALNFIVDLVDPPAFMRLKYTRTSGGGSSTVFRALGSERGV